jgi:hypothetical protein
VTALHYDEVTQAHSQTCEYTSVFNVSSAPATGHQLPSGDFQGYCVHAKGADKERYHLNFEENSEGGFNIKGTNDNSRYPELPYLVSGVIEPPKPGAEDWRGRKGQIMHIWVVAPLEPQQPVLEQPVPEEPVPLQPQLRKRAADCSPNQAGSSTKAHSNSTAPSTTCRRCCCCCCSACLYS